MELRDVLTACVLILERYRPTVKEKFVHFIKLLKTVILMVNLGAKNNPWLTQKTTLYLIMKVCFGLNFINFLSIKSFDLSLSLGRKLVRDRAGRVSDGKRGVKVKYAHPLSFSLSYPTLLPHSSFHSISYSILLMGLKS